MGGVTVMREIKFRGKNDNGQWHFGDLSTSKHFPPQIVEGELYPRFFFVCPETVGQFTGMYDSEGREIYEGDILGNKYPNYYKYKFANAVVEWGVDGWLADCFSLREWLKLHTCVVVGNIYENSELLPELSEVKDARD